MLSRKLNDALSSRLFYAHFIGISVTLKAAVSANCFSKRKTIRKLIADAFSAKSAVVDRLHDYVGCNAVCRLAVANHK